MVKTSANNSLNVSGLRCLCFDMEGVEIPALGTSCILKSLDSQLIIKGFFYLGSKRVAKNNKWAANGPPKMNFRENF